MKRYLIALALLATPAAAQQQTPAEYTLKITAEDVVTLGKALDELPMKISRPLVQRLSAQVQAQDADYAKAHPMLDKTPAKK